MVEVADDLIALDSVVKRYDNFTALKGVSLAIRQGEFLALLGPSGCGKTTLLRLIAGFTDPSEGEIRIDGRRMNGVPPNRRPVNTVFQNYALFPHLTVVQNVAFGPKRRGIPTAKIASAVAEALSLVGMASFGERYPSELSGGQQQRVALARAVVNRPRVLLLDEPLGALDLQLRKRMQLELKHLQAKLGITFVFVTHDQEEALVMADRIAVMSEGAVMQIGTGEAIYYNPTNRFVASFIGDANLVPADLLPGSTAPHGCVVMIRPEAIDVGLAPDANYDSAEVVVRERVFLGSQTRVHAALGADQPLVFQPSRSGRAQTLAPGDRVTVHWRRDQSRILET